MRILTILATCLVFLGCASQNTGLESPNSVLEPETQPPTAEGTLPAPATSPTLNALQMKLTELGITGTGIELESPQTLELLLEVFSQPDIAKYAIRTVYTGAAMDYDVADEALTVGGLKTSKDILAFIQKKVPLRKAP